MKPGYWNGAMAVMYSFMQINELIPYLIFTPETLMLLFKRE